MLNGVGPLREQLIASLYEPEPLHRPRERLVGRPVRTTVPLRKGITDLNLRLRQAAEFLDEIAWRSPKTCADIILKRTGRL